jgi:Transcriptional regulator
MSRSTQKETILLAAVRVIIRDGLMSLTLDAVAKEAGVSKGGLLYHFPSKDALIGSMIDHFQQEKELQIRKIAEADPHPQGAMLRAFISTSLSDCPHPAGLDNLSKTDTMALKMSLLAAIALNPQLLEIVRNRSRNWVIQLLEQSSDPLEDWITCLAVDGLWLWQLFGVLPADDNLRSQLEKRLLKRSLPVQLPVTEPTSKKPPRKSSRSSVR